MKGYGPGAICLCTEAQGKGLHGSALSAIMLPTTIPHAQQLAKLGCFALIITIGSMMRLELKMLPMARHLL